jgi:hypothetical protein
VVTIDEQGTDVQEPGPDRTEAGSAERLAPPTAERGPSDPESAVGGPDARCAAAVDLARGAAEQIADPGTVGDHLGVIAEGDRVVTHRFGCASRGYRGWHWAVTVARTPGSEDVTVSETVLLPGEDAVLSLDWVPWSDRLQPGDLGASDVLPRRPDDPNLVPGFEQVALEYGDEVDLYQFWELGLGRVRVLGPQGRESAADRWYSGEHGPTADESVHAASACATCGYFVPLAGALRQVFGVCANEWSPSDGQVVSVDHGCGAHSETDVEQPEPTPLPEPILDELGAETVVVLREEIQGEPAAAEPTEAVPEPEPIPSESPESELPVADTGTEPTRHEAESEPAPEPEPESEPAPEPEPEPEPGVAVPEPSATEAPAAAESTSPEPDPANDVTAPPE